MEAKHTPGPWRLEIGNECCFHDSNRVAIVSDWEHVGEKNTVTIAEVWPADGDTDIADGRLIAAAPDLLAALEELVQASYDSVNGKQYAPYHVEELARATIAIAKTKEEN